MAILVKSCTATSDKNRWATTWECFSDAQHLFGRPFTIDVAAEPATAKVERFFISPEFFRFSDWATQLTKTKNKVVGVDALSLDWPDGWWCNPPFDYKQEFITHALKQAKAGRSGMMLLPHEPLTGWWRELVNDAATIVYTPDGRYPFYEVDGKTKKQGVNFGSSFILFTPHYHQRTEYVPFNRYIDKHQGKVI
ncbi:DNA N-6-adenine-methyltransferase [Photobacterium toruni]|uniref:DNA N-6-adenine-methyltransferase n=1 Tax=Photobacterium toruni TaxID=1935446 RepID=A0ABU6L9Y0_9GAMM|nr:DNA N-6-adenine-methyltransferase [Photobacterium toruni]